MDKKLITLLIIIFSVGVVIGNFWSKKSAENREFSGKPIKKVETVHRKEPAAKIAIVIDDFGYNLNCIDELLSIKRPITLAILPHLSFSKRICEITESKNYEFILHMPMQPYSKEVHLEKGTLLVGMSDAEVKTLLGNAIDSLPWVVGISNHMGSAATQDKQLIMQVFTELKKRNMFFLDSLVTSKTVCKQLAKKTGLPIASRDVFLDNKNEEEYIKNQMSQLLKIALKHGEAIGLGHARELTLSVIGSMIKEFEERGVEFVFVSELTKI